MLKVFYTNISLITPSQRDKILLCVSEKKRRLYEKSAKKSLASAVGELLLGYALYEALGIRADFRLLKYNSLGKPYFDIEGVHFNISHSGCYVVCALADSPIGIDIEKIKPHSEGLYRRALNEEELLYIKSCPDEAREFTRLWTRKESYLKKEGCGISSPLCLINSLQLDCRELWLDEEYILTICT